VLRTVGLIGDRGKGERRGVLRERDGLEDWAACVEMLRDSFGFMALDEASMMTVFEEMLLLRYRGRVVICTTGLFDQQRGTCSVYKTMVMVS